MSEYQSTESKPTRELPPWSRWVTGRRIPDIVVDSPLRSRTAEGQPDITLDEAPTQKCRDAIEDWIDLAKLKSLVECHLCKAKRRTALTPEQRTLADASEGLAVAFASTRWRKGKRVGLSFDQVVAAAKLGLEDAVAKFDPAKGKLAGLAWGYMMRRVVELHESHDDDPKPKAAFDPARMNRWALEWFEWPQWPDVQRELARLAKTGEAGFDTDDLELLRRRAEEGQTQAQIAAAVGLTVKTIRRRELRAVELIAPVMFRLCEESTDRYLMSTLEPDELRRIYGHQAPWQAEREDAIAEARDRQSSRHNYGRIN
jgi:hypothetical protein